MKIQHWLLSLLLAAPALAQEPPDDLAAPPPGEERPEGFRPGEMGRPGPGNRPAFGVDVWLEKMRTENPEEFERMKLLRNEDPEAFRAELRKKIRHEIGERLKRERPSVHAALENLSPEDREWLIGKFNPRGESTGGVMGGPGNRGQRGPGPGGDQKGPQGNPDDERLRSLANAYRAATDDAEKETIKAQLRTHLAESFEKRSERRRQELAQFEKRIAEMKKTLEDRQANRETIIDKRLGELTDSVSSDW